MTWISLLFCSAAIAQPQDFSARLAVLETHRQALERVAVPAELEPEKQTRLLVLKRRIADGVETAEQVNTIWRKLEQTREWLLTHAAERPALPTGSFVQGHQVWIISNPVLHVTVDRKTFALDVRTPATGWRFRPCDEGDVVLQDGTSFSLASAQIATADAFRTGYSTGMELKLAGFPDRPSLTLHITMELVGPELLIEIAPGGDIEYLATLGWPKPIETGNSDNDLSVIPMMQGILLPGNWPQELHRKDLANSRTLYMPWWGQQRGAQGVLTILETSDDAGVAYDHPEGGPTRFQPLWYSSLGRLSYPRRIRYVFDDTATYVRMAKRYRRLVQEMGHFVSLAEKRIRTPNLDEVIGRPVVHIGALYHNVEGSRFFDSQQPENNHRLTTFAEVAGALRTLKDQGIEDAYVHLDGWGYRGYDNVHPDVIPPGPEQGGWNGLRALADTCDALGYLLAVHDQYRDFYLKAVSFDERLTVTRADGSRDEHAEWSGGRQTYLSPRFAPGYVRRNHDAFAAQGVKIRGAYLDVFAVVPLEESFQPAHPVTRSDCARYRRECFDLLRARGYVTSSEEPADYVVPSIDLVHHGPYPTLPKGYGPGKALGIPVPLFNLVYHDALLIPWPMADDGGWGIPDGDAAWLHCLLNAGLPYVSPGAKDEKVERARKAAALALRLGLQEMVNHEFLDAERRLQRTTFADGTQVTADFARKTVEITP